MRVYKHLDENDLLPKEQKGCRRGSYGSKDQLLINKAIIEDAKKRKNLSTAWIDYKHRHTKRARVIFFGDRSIRRTVHSNDLLKFLLGCDVQQEGN